MKQIFYGPTGYGKSHIILHGLLPKQKLVIITTNGLQREFEYVGLNNIPINVIPISAKNSLNGSIPDITIHQNYDLDSMPPGILGFDLFSIPCAHEEIAINKVIEWLEKNSISDDYECTIVLLNITKEIQDSSFIRKIENWNADVIIEHTCDKFSIEYHNELEHIRKSGKWFEVPIFRKLSENPRFIMCRDESV